MKFLNAPWKVERSPGELLVLDSRNNVIAALQTDPEDRPGTLEEEEAKAFAIAALPEIYIRGSAFLAAINDPILSQDEEALLKYASELEAALNAAEIIPPSTERPKK